jgi:hypothetical protein
MVKHGHRLLALHRSERFEGLYGWGLMQSVHTTSLVESFFGLIVLDEAAIAKENLVTACHRAWSSSGPSSSTNSN